MVLLFCVFFLSLFVKREHPAASLRILEYMSQGDSQVIFFEQKLDLSGQFKDFNLKQVFVYVKAIYPGAGSNSEIIWSKIVGRGDDKKLAGMFKSSYDVTGDITSRTIFELRGSYIPFVGMVWDVLFDKKEVEI